MAWNSRISYAHRPAVKAVAAVYFSGRPSDNELLTINSRKYEVDKNSTFPEAAGNVKVDANAAGNTDADITAFAAAINGDSSAECSAVADTTNDVLWLYALTGGTAGNSLTLAEGLSNATISKSTFVDGLDSKTVAIVPIRHTITTEEAAGGFLRFDTGLTSIQTVQLTWEDAGVEAVTGIAVVVSSGSVTLTEGIAWANGDILNILVIGTL